MKTVQHHEPCMVLKFKLWRKVEYGDTERPKTIIINVLQSSINNLWARLQESALHCIICMQSKSAVCTVQ